MRREGINIETKYYLIAIEYQTTECELEEHFVIRATDAAEAEKRFAAELRTWLTYDELEPDEYGFYEKGEVLYKGEIVKEVDESFVAQCPLSMLMLGFGMNNSG